MVDRKYKIIRKSKRNRIIYCNEITSDETFFYFWRECGKRLKEFVSEVISIDQIVEAEE